jgi:protein adenylyltransferase
MLSRSLAASSRPISSKSNCELTHMLQFVPRSWILDEVIERVEKKGDREILGRVMHMALNPFNDEWGLNNRQEEERFCGDVPRLKRAMTCSCSS